MGCVNSTYTPPRNRNRQVVRLKPATEYAKSGSALKPVSHKNVSDTHSSKDMEVAALVEIKKTVVSSVSGRKATSDSSIGEWEERDRVKGVAVNDDKSEVETISNKSEEKKKIASYEHADEWPKWLVDNIPHNNLARLVRKTADSYEKLEKVNNTIFYGIV